MLALGVDLGGTKIAAGVVNGKGRVLSCAEEPTNQAGGKKAVIRQMLRMSDKVLKISNVSTKDLLGIGIGAAGPQNIKSGFLLTPPNFPGWKKVQIVKPFKKHFKCPVYLNNDANAAAVGEWLFGAGKGLRHLVYMTISTGIGGGIIADGKLYQGANNNAGELGHITIEPDGPLCGCGNYGCLEAHASGTSIARYAREAARHQPGSLLMRMADSSPEKITAKMVFQAAKQGDRAAKEVAEKCAEFLGIGIAGIINAFNPQRVILGGGVTRAGRLLFTTVRRVAKARSMKALSGVVDIVPAKLGKNVGVVGAAALVFCGQTQRRQSRQ